MNIIYYVFIVRMTYVFVLVKNDEKLT